MQINDWEGIRVVVSREQKRATIVFVLNKKQNRLAATRIRIRGLSFYDKGVFFFGRFSSFITVLNYLLIIDIEGSFRKSNCCFPLTFDHHY